MAVALYGDTGLGKTKTSVKFCEKNDIHYLFIRSLEDLWEYNPTHKVIIFDDISFELSRPELLIHLTDREFHAPVRILQKCVKIVPETCRIFTHNERKAWQPILSTVAQQAAIDRRLNVIEVKSQNSRAQIWKALQEQILPHLL